MELHLPNEAQLDTIFGFLWAEERRRLAYLASQVPAHLPIVELGSLMGLSTAYLAFGSRAGHGARVYAVDNWVGLSPPGSPSDPNLRTSFYETIARFGLGDIVEPIEADTREAARSWSGDIGLLFIDAAHDYESEKGDFVAWVPFLAEGGRVLIHDCEWPGPTAVIDEYIRNSDRWAVEEQVRGLFCARLLKRDAHQPG